MENPDNTQLGTDDWNVNSDLNGRKLIFARSSLGSDVPMELDEIENDLRRQTKDSVTTDDFEKWRNSDILSSHADGLKEGSFKENKDHNVQEISINGMNVSTRSLSCTVDNRVIDISTTNSDINEVIESLEAKKEPTYSSLESKIPSNSSDVHSKSESEILSIHHQPNASKDCQKSAQEVSQGPSFSDQIFETPFLKCKPSHDDDSLLEQIIPLEVRIENATDRTLNENDANTSCHDSIQNQAIGFTPVLFSPTKQIKTSTLTNQLENDPTSQRPIKQSTVKNERDSKPSLEITAGYSKEITNNDLLKKGTSNSTIITTKQNILPGKRELSDVALKFNDPKSTLLPVTPKYCEDFKIPEEEISTAQPSCKYPKAQEIRTECSSSPPSSASLTTPKSSKSDIPINTELIDSKKSARNLPSSQGLKRKVAPIATKTYSTATEDALYSELKAIKIASITARITAIQADIVSKRTRIEEINKELKAPAAETVKRHIKLLHEYNDIRDVGQGLIGMIADQRGVRIGDLYDEFGVGLKD